MATQRVDDDVRYSESESTDREALDPTSRYKLMRRSLSKKFLIITMQEVLEISEAQVVYTSSRLKKESLEEYNKHFGKNIDSKRRLEAEERISELINDKDRLLTQEKVKELYHQIILLGAGGTNHEYLFLREAREYFLINPGKK